MLIYLRVTTASFRLYPFVFLSKKRKMWSKVYCLVEEHDIMKTIRLDITTFRQMTQYTGAATKLAELCQTVPVPTLREIKHRILSRAGPSVNRSLANKLQSKRITPQIFFDRLYSQITPNRTIQYFALYKNFTAGFIASSKDREFCTLNMLCEFSQF